jgi:hypothetical protein
LKAVNIYHNDEVQGGVVAAKYYPDFATTDALTTLGKPVDKFSTSGSSQSQVRCHDTVGYIHRIEFDASGSENPFECRFLECAFEAREKDK